MLLNDEPTIDDTLDRTSLVNEVAQVVSKCRPPQVFGIHGDWGLGKTSFLHQLQMCLTGTSPLASPETPLAPEAQKLATVWFEAWRYQYEQAPIVALLHEIRSQLS